MLNIVYSEGLGAIIPYQLNRKMIEYFTDVFSGLLRRENNNG